MFCELPTDTVAVQLQICEELCQRIIHEAAKRGHSLPDEIIRRLRSSLEQDAREEALHSIASIVEAADSTISEIQRLLTIVKPAKFSQIDPIDRWKRQA